MTGRIDELENIEKYVLDAYRTAALSGCTTKIEAQDDTGEIGSVSEYPGPGSWLQNHTLILEFSNIAWMDGLELGAKAVETERYRSYIVPTANTIFEDLGRDATDAEMEWYDMKYEDKPRVIREGDMYDMIDWEEELQPLIDQAEDTYAEFLSKIPTERDERTKQEQHN